MMALCRRTGPGLARFARYRRQPLEVDDYMRLRLLVKADDRITVAQVMLFGAGHD